MPHGMYRKPHARLISCQTCDLSESHSNMLPHLQLVCVATTALEQSTLATVVLAVGNGQGGCESVCGEASERPACS